MKPSEETTEEPQNPTLEHTDSQFTKVLVESLRVGSVELAQQPLSLLGGDLVIQVDGFEKIPQFLLGGILGGVNVCSLTHLVAEHAT